MSKSKSNTSSLAAARRKAEVDAMNQFYQRHPEMAPTGNRGSLSNGEYQVSLEHGLLQRAFGGTPQCVKLPDGSWAQAAWGNPRVTEADDADGGDEFAGWVPPTGYNTTGDSLADGQITV